MTVLKHVDIVRNDIDGYEDKDENDNLGLISTDQLFIENDDNDDNGNDGEGDDEELSEEEILIEQINDGNIWDMLEVAEEKLTREVCMAFVSQNGSNFRFVPDNIRCDEFDNEAVLIDSWAFGYLEEEKKTESLLLKCINQSKFCDPAMLGEEWAVPINLLTDEILRAADVKFGAAQVEKWISQRVGRKRKLDIEH